MGMLFPGGATALSRHVFSTSFSGSGPLALTNPTDVAVDNSGGPSAGDVYVADTPLNETQGLTVNATGGTYTLTFNGRTTEPIAYDAPAGNFASHGVDTALGRLSSIFGPTEPASSNINVTGPDGGPYTIEFRGNLGGTDQPQITADPAHLTGGTSAVSVTTSRNGGGASDVEKFSPAGAFLLVFGKEVNKTKVTASAPAAEQNVCTAASGDECQHGTVGTALGAYRSRTLKGQGSAAETVSRLFLAVDNSDGPSAGDVYVGDPGDNLVTKLDPSGRLIPSWGDEGRLDGSSAQHGVFGLVRSVGMSGIAVGADGTLIVAAQFAFFQFASDGSHPTFMERFGSIVTVKELGIAVDGGGNADVLQSDSAGRYSGGIVYTPLTRSAGSNAIGSKDGFLLQEQSIGGLKPAGLSSDQTSRELYATREDGTVAHYLGSCEPIATPCNTFEIINSGELSNPNEALSNPKGLAINEATDELYVADTGDHRVVVFTPVPYRPDATHLSAVGLTPASEKMIGRAEPASAGPVESCYFEYGATTAYGSAPVPCSPPASLGSPFGAVTEVQAEASSLSYGTTYHFHLVVENAGGPNASYDEEFTTLPLAPSIGAESIGEVQPDTVLIHVQINPNGGATSYHLEYVDDAQFQASGFADAGQGPTLDAGSSKTPQDLVAHLGGLRQGTIYHYRVLATNATDTTTGPAHTFTTLPFAETNDPCANAHVRQQTSAAGLLDCRAYELVSAANTAGYDVESNLIPGQEPFAGYPDASGRVLYGVHSGGIPGTNHPTNRGVDPYVASRGEGGWSTEYVGVPANNPFAAGPFSSTPSGADANLETFAFAGPGGCSPCFAGGYTGIPVHRPNGELTQGMAGPESPGPSAEVDGYVAKDLSADGKHLIFSSTSLFAPGGNPETGDVSIYDHNLQTDQTHVVSNQPGTEDFPEALECLQGSGKCDAAEGDADGIAELNISNDGSHILIGQKVSEEEGTPYWHLYMNVNDAVRSIDLTPAATEGVLYDGMSADGTKVFFSSEEHLTGEDIEHSGADIFMWEEASDSLTLITKGDGNACEPVANSAHLHWNTIDPEEETCGAVAVGGGGGVSAANGSIYFLSPERLAGNGNSSVQDAPNLYVARPGDGYATHYVATLESALTGPNPPVLKHTFKSDFGAFTQATGLGIDHGSGDLYVFDAGSEALEKFDAEGNPVDFTAGPGASTNRLTGPSATGTGNLESGSTTIASVSTETGAFSVGETIEAPGLPSETTVTAVGAGTLEVSQAATESVTQSLNASQRFSSSFNGIAYTSQIAVDSASDFYVPDIENGVVDKFSSAGEYLGQISGLASPDAIAIDPSNGNLYVSGLFGSIYVFDSSGNPVSEFFAEGFPLSISVDSSGGFYIARFFGGTAAYDSSGNFVRMLNEGLSESVNVDSSTNDVYVDEGEAVTRYDTSGQKLETLGSLSGSYGVAMEPEGNLYATDHNGTEIAVFNASLAPRADIDSPLVVDSVSSPASRQTADFQTTPDAAFAAFPTTLSLPGTGAQTAGHTVLYRYDASAQRLDCVSCTVAGLPSVADSSLPVDGQSLADDGRVFFNSSDQLVAADTDNRLDAYQWEPSGSGNCSDAAPTFSGATGTCLALISAGTSAFDSGLLAASADGVDAYFFTRDSLAPQDENGPTMKIYDAREGGGFPYEYPAVPCKASDECHGASSPAPGPLKVGSGTFSSEEVVDCKKGFVKKHGRCVKRHRRSKHRHPGHRGGHK